MKDLSLVSVDEIKDNEWQTPIYKNYKLVCCGCGLTHLTDFRMHKGNIQFRVRRLDVKKREGRMKVPMNAISNTIEILLRTDSKRATKFLNEHLVVRATRKLYHGKLNRRDDPEIVLSIGRPNYREREIIKQIKKAREPFPVKKIKLDLIKK
jgi:hypothetical protein